MTELSDCAGKYEVGDLVCDGSIYSNIDPCGWKVGCKALKKFCETYSLDIDVFTTGKTLEEIEEYITEFIPLPPARKNSKRTTGIRYSKELWRIYEHFEKTLSRNFFRRVTNRITVEQKRKVVFEQGRIFPIDLLKTDGYIIWKCKRIIGGGGDMPIALVHFRPNLNALTIGLPVGVKHIKGILNKDELVQLDLRYSSDRKFRSKVLNCRTKEVEIVTSLLRRSVDKGILKLPKNAIGIMKTT